MTVPSLLVPRDITDDDWPGVALLAATSYGSFWHPETFAAWRTMMPPRSSVVVRDGDDVVGMAHYVDLKLTVPGGAILPTAGITWVGVAPTHRRRGLLRAMYANLHQRFADAGYPLAGLTATEGGIYGRFGYGPATVETELTMDRRFARFHRDAIDPGGVRIVRPGEHRDELAAIYDRHRLITPGGLQRPTALWDDLLADWDDSRGGGSRWNCFLHADGYLLYRVHRGHARNVRVEEFTAVTAEAHVALWRALIGLDLVETISVSSHPADPLPHLLDDSRLVRTTGSEDGLWLRIMDVPTALEARTYASDLDTVIEIGDGFRSDGGRFALTIHGGRARCVRTDAPAEFVTDLDVLGSLYLGVQRAATLSAANRIRCGNRESLHLLDAAFRSDVPAQLGFNF
ncbi:enhanced intracellular survival protein Eis [Mycolicibacterium hodleri]|uniref:Enhanced intracellular survival protein Eis n=1 Tax=Mycolicibacterium hodleri TaxID=49897 RepID=A0A502EA80_9MYCO|nr:enhanced intracellular survival protein Eis [Mycolicibacterium hodleri]TPG34625.1 enhanced intracellular survival protein Eis [Mycolicibacterium hodleri]